MPEPVRKSCGSKGDVRRLKENSRSHSKYTRENDMEKITNYGPILIRKGPYKGRIGYYDDTDMDGKLIIYPNVPIYCSDYYKVSQSAATSVIPTACLAERLSDIDHELYKNCSLKHLSAKEEIMLLHERIFEKISTGLCESKALIMINPA